ncbi:MAG TPA: GNAT family N-acetyltransferase [Xanthomonadaceae bacterium]|nr:GNAT family N-acetyltransferase [Xanthomonadaceae bacterium]
MLLRPIHPLDAEPLRAGFELLDPEEVRMRFLHPMRELTPEMAHRLTHLDPAREFALVVAEPLPPGQALVGAVAREAVDQDRREAEFAILVSRYLSGQGLGVHLMRKLVRWAQLKRLDAIYGNALYGNTRMLELAASLGFDRERVRDDPGMVRVRKQLR